jgi:hypothetical protein
MILIGNGNHTFWSQVSWLKLSSQSNCPVVSRLSYCLVAGQVGSSRARTVRFPS